MPKAIAPPKSERTAEEIAALDIPEAAIEQPEDDSVGRIIADHIKPTLTGLVITGELSCEDWLKAAEFYQFLRSRTQWIIGDILRYGESRYGEKYAQAVDDHGKSSSRLSTYVYVCNRFEIERRRPELSFDHHAEAAGLDPREADRVLLEAIKMRWTKQDVREEVARINERNGVPRRGRKPGSVSAKLAASGKQPQVPEGEKPLIWNGYPLRVANVNGYRQIYQGNESLANDEADKAAHQFGHAHGPALAAWLEEHNFRKEEQPCAPSEQSASPASVVPTKTSSGTETQAAPSTVASNGAAPNATESAPTPLSKLLSEPSVFEGGTGPFECEPTALAAPATPPASPEPAKATDTPPSVADEILAIMATYREQEQRGDIDTPGGLEHMGDVWRLFKKWEGVLRSGDLAASGASPAAPATPQTPLQRAEEAILAFNAASEEVDWKAVGQDKLLKLKWLSRLLARADIVIDLVQGTAPVERWHPCTVEEPS